jgi:mRNA interferase RelE/StbE
MRLRIDWKPRAEKDRDRLDARMRARVLAAIERYAETGEGDVRALRGSRGELRLRVGDWRVRFALDFETATMVVLHVLPRGSAYR